MGLAACGSLYVAGGVSGLVHRYDGATGEFIDIFAIPPNRQNATGIVFGPDGRLFVGTGVGRVVYEFDGTTYRECSDPDCRCHQQWVCALDRWSDAFEAPSPRERQGQRQAEREDSPTAG